MDDEIPPDIQSRLLALFPAGTQIVETQTYRPGYALFPMRVSLRHRSQGVQRCVVKIGRGESLEREVQALRLLAPLGLPVAEVLTEPLALPSGSGEEALVVLSELPGRALPWINLNSLSEADLTCRLLLEGVARLHALTERIEPCAVSPPFPRLSLLSELAAAVEQAGAWMQLDLFRRAVEVLDTALPDITAPLVFSNGDYNPLNFLVEGEALSGFVDFEGVCFEDPHIGFSKFLIWSLDDYGWGTGKKAGLVERYLYSRNVSRREFAPRLVLRCLRHLIQEVSVDKPEDAVWREHMFQIIREGLAAMKPS